MFGQDARQNEHKSGWACGVFTVSACRRLDLKQTTSLQLKEGPPGRGPSKLMKIHPRCEGSISSPAVADHREASDSPMVVSSETEGQVLGVAGGVAINQRAKADLMGDAGAGEPFGDHADHDA